MFVILYKHKHHATWHLWNNSLWPSQEVALEILAGVKEQLGARGATFALAEVAIIP